MWVSVRSTPSTLDNHPAITSASRSCSATRTTAPGLMTWAYRQAGVDLPHSSREQARMGSPMSRAQLQPGDLVAQERLCP